MEFLYVLGFMILLLTAYSAILLTLYAEMKDSQNRLTVQKYVELIAMEINQAALSSSGYSSNITLPERTEGFNYTLYISSDQNMISLDTGEYTASASLETGQPRRRIEIVRWNYGGVQIIEKVGETVVVK